MAGFAVTDAHGQLTGRSIDLMKPSWRIDNMPVLWSTIIRGSSAFIPFREGRVSTQRRKDEQRYGLHMFVDGGFTEAGAVVTGHANKIDQVHEHIETLSVLADPPEAETGDTWVWQPPGLNERTATGWVENWNVTDVQHTAICGITFTLVLPDPWVEVIPE